MVEFSSWEVLGWILVLGVAVYMIRTLLVGNSPLTGGGELLRAGKGKVADVTTSIRATLGQQYEQLRAKGWVTTQDFEPLKERVEVLEAKLGVVDSSLFEFRTRLDKVEKRLETLEIRKKAQL